MATYSGLSRPLVLDNWPLMEWLKGRQPTSTLIRKLFADAFDGNIRLLLDRVNLGEIYYLAAKEAGIARAEEMLGELSQVQLQIIEPSANSVMAAARLKAAWNISYADAFTAALAIKYSAPVLTGDPDFLRLESAGLLRVEWIGR